MKTVARNFAAENWEANDRISGTPTKNDVVYIDCDGRGETIAAVWLPCLIGREQDEVEQEALALARVIAAAPEMLAALQLIFNDAEDGYDTRLTFKGHDAVRDAIAKALGNA